MTADIEQGKNTAIQVTYAMQDYFNSISKEYPNISVEFAGEVKETRGSIIGIAWGYLIAIIAIYVILLLQFNKFVQPFMILGIIPFGIIGVILGFAAHRMPMSFVGAVGIVGLAGVVVNNGIIMVELINRILEKGNIHNKQDVLNAIKTLKEAGLTQVQISLDSYKKEVHEKYRTEGSFDRAIQTARLFKKHGYIVGVDTVVTNNNIDDLEEFMNFLEDNNFDGLTIIKLKQGYLDLETFMEQVPEYNKYAQLIDKICKRKGNLEITIDCSSVSNLCKTLTLEEQNKIHSAGCPAGHTLISIAPNGDMYPCAALTNEKYKIGNILTDDLEKIWNENEILRKLRGIKKHVEGKCKNCIKLDVCRAGCRGIADSLSGKQYISDANCKISL